MAEIRVGEAQKVCLEEMNLFFKKVERGHVRLLKGWRWPHASMSVNVASSDQQSSRPGNGDCRGGGGVTSACGGAPAMESMVEAGVGGLVLD